MAFFQNPKDPDVRDRYGVNLDTGWLDGETIVSASFTPTEAGSGLIINNTNISGNEVSAYFEGGAIGFHPILVRIETPTRQREDTVVLWVKEA